MLIKINFIALNLLVAYCFEVNKDQQKNETAIQDLLETEDVKFHVPNDEWITEAIKNIAYYLRNHKFNEWDQRYYVEKPNENVTGFFAAFPIPPLWTLHWEVKANCYNDFYKCIIYLHSIIRTASYLRAKDSVNIKPEVLDEKTIIKLDSECKKRHLYGNKFGLPFDDPAEKFQWSTTASYYMCWYTMLGTPALSLIGERCDNFANCLDSFYKIYNDDPRANDNFSFNCALYSFCPDPCCPVKHVNKLDKCLISEKNPCFVENMDKDPPKGECQMDRKFNQNLYDIINNRWNISCNCEKGFKWSSKFGMCVDINECLLHLDKCDVSSQDCLNLPGTFLCICKWEFQLDINRALCIKRNATVSLI